MRRRIAFEKLPTNGAIQRIGEQFGFRLYRDTRARVVEAEIDL